MINKHIKIINRRLAYLNKQLSDHKFSQSSRNFILAEKAALEYLLKEVEEKCRYNVENVKLVP